MTIITVIQQNGSPAQVITADENSDYVLPAATTTDLGGVKQAAKQNDIVKESDLAAVIVAVNNLFASMRDAGIIAK